MFNKLYEKIKKYIKENYKLLIIFLSLFVVCTFPLPYYIYNTGGTINIDTRIDITDEYKSTGSFNFAYVSELKATLPTYLLSKVIKSWECVKIDDYKLTKEETVKEVNYRDHISLEDANQSALKVAYEKAGKQFLITDVHYYVLYVDEKSNTNLKIGDEIIAIDGQELSSLDQYRDIVSSKNYHDKLAITVMVNGKKEDRYAEIINIDSNKLTGIYISSIYDYTTKPQVTLHFTKSESGPSGGLMLALTAYNKLVKEDITHGKKIVGTGTINMQGEVGEIGGISYKLRGAVKDKADVFLVPRGDNYRQAQTIKKEEHMKIDIIPVATFDEAVRALENL